MSNLEIIEISFGSLLYEQSKTFRHEILRRPLGLTLSAADIVDEDKQIHIVALEAGEVLGTVLLKPLNDGVVKLRQMAVSPRTQGSGCGRKLVLYAEQTAVSRGFGVIELNARVSARGFYEKLGYAAFGDEFIEVTVPTIKMVKSLSS